MGVSRMQNEGVLDYSLSKRGQKGSKSVRNGGFSTRSSGGDLCVYGGSHSPTRRPPVLINRAARRDLAALAPLATGPHGLIDLRAVLARCLRGRRGVLAVPVCAGPALMVWQQSAAIPCRPAAAPAASPSARHGSPPTGPTAAARREQDRPAGPPQPWPSGQPDGSGLPPAPWGSGPGGPLPGGGLLI